VNLNVTGLPAIIIQVGFIVVFSAPVIAGLGIFSMLPSRFKIGCVVSTGIPISGFNFSMTIEGS
jgi:hypothetical protein